MTDLFATVTSAKEYLGLLAEANAETLLDVRAQLAAALLADEAKPARGMRVAVLKLEQNALYLSRLSAATSGPSKGSGASCVPDRNRKRPNELHRA